MNKELRQLAVQLYKGEQQAYTKQEANDYLRNYIKDICGGEFNAYKFNAHKYEIFEVMAEVLTESTSALARETFEPIAQFKDTALGDKVEFLVGNADLYDVAVIASGHNNLLRQRLVGRKVPTSAFDLGVKIYAEFNEFITGRIDWTELVDKVAKSVNTKIAQMIAVEWKVAYDSVVEAGELAHTGTMDEAQLLELVEKVATQGEGEPVIYGTKLALAKIKAADGYEPDARDKKELGYVREAAGCKCVELENKYDIDTKTWALENDKLYIIPSDVKPLCIGFEGDAFVQEDTTGTRLDRQLEYLFTRKMHIGIAKTKNFGIYKIS